MTDKLERLARIEAEAAALRKEIEAEAKKTVCFTPEAGEEYWQICADDKKHFSTIKCADNFPGAAFRDKATAEAYAEAFNVMIELRLHADGGIWSMTKPIFTKNAHIEPYAGWGETSSGRAFAGSYSSEAQAQKAIDAVGEERIIRAVKVLCGAV